MKVLKNFFLYAFILIGLCIVAVIICALAMVLFKAEILGYKYTSVFEQKTDLVYEVSNFSAIEIITNNMDVNLIPSKTEGVTTHKVGVNYSTKTYGFVKVGADKFSYTAVVSTKSLGFDEDPTSRKTLIITIAEPTGLIMSEGSLNVYIPQDKLAIVSVSTNKGKATVYKTENETLTLNQLYVETNKGDIAVGESNLNEVYAKSSTGTINFSTGEDKEINSKISIKADKSMINLQSPVANDVKIESEASSVGPSLRAGIIKGSLIIDIKAGKIEVTQIGTETSNKKIDLKADSANVQIGTIYGRAYIARKEDSSFSIGLKIGKLISGSEAVTSSINTGKGNLEIGQINAPLSATTTSGNIILSKVAQTESGKIALTGGSGANINVTYDKEITPPEGSTLSIVLGSGNLTAKNIKVVTTVTVTSDRSGKIDLEFIRVIGSVGSPESFSSLNINNHELNLKINSSSIYRLLVSQPANSSLSMEETGGSLGTSEVIVEGKIDYPAETTNYKILKRINYSESGYETAGNLKIFSSGGSVKINGYIPA